LYSKKRENNKRACARYISKENFEKKSE